MAVTYALLIAWSLVCLLPFYWVAAMSVMSSLNITAGPVYLPFVDFVPSLDAWRYVLFDANGDVLHRMANTAIAATAATALSVSAGAMAVYGVSRFNPLLGRGLLPALLSARILPPVVVVLPVYLLAQHTGVLDTRFVLIATYTAVNLPVAAWLLRPVFGDAASDAEEAATLDGASRWRVFAEIAVPMAWRGILAAASLVFLLCWNEYLFAVYLTGGHAETMPPYLAAQMTVREQQAGSDAEEWTRLAAAVLLLSAPPMAAAALAARWIGRKMLWRA